jgi:hypothetical protein
VEPNTSSALPFAFVDQADLVAWQRSAAMAAPETTLAVKREELLEVLAELIATRALLARLGADLKTVARRASAS